MFKKTALYVIIISSAIFHIPAMSSSKNQTTFNTIFTGCNDFTNPLYTNLAANVDKNIIISPLSLHIILSLLCNGAKGSTFNELRSVLGYNDLESVNDEYKALIIQLNDIKNVTLYLKNAAYVQKEVDLLEDFLSIGMNTFQSSLSKIDFEDNTHAVEIINSWIHTATNSTILNIISPSDIDTDTKLLLLNAIYFKCGWLKTFNKEDTKPRIFYVSKTKSYLVPTMFKNAAYFYGEIPTLHTQFIEIPYLNEDIVMIILLPDEDVELQDVEKNFNWETFVNSRRSSGDFELYLPKFKFEISINLKDVLHKIGLNMMFKDGADFTHISKLPLKVSNVLQKVFIEVDEQGCEAAAVTVAKMRLRRSIIPPMKFVVDRPFMFAIEHRPTKLPLFLGSVRALKSFPVKDEL